jgi:tRNA(fMet)-specific endonuclease VapC
VRYLLDTNICVYIAKRRPAKTMARFEQLQPGDVGMSVVTLLELTYGALKSQQVAENLARLEQLERVIPAQPLDAKVARDYGRIRADLERKGAPIGAYDLLIAAHAMSLGVTLVTNNLREFKRVPGLKVENWVE